MPDSVTLAVGKFPRLAVGVELELEGWSWVTGTVNMESTEPRAVPKETDIGTEVVRTADILLLTLANELSEDISVSGLSEMVNGNGDVVFNSAVDPLDMATLSMPESGLLERAEDVFDETGGPVVAVHVGLSVVIGGGVSVIEDPPVTKLVARDDRADVADTP